MHLKRYRSVTVREALAQARADLGPNALVLATRLVSARGWRGLLGYRVVEVTAAANREVSESRPFVHAAPQPEPAAPTLDPVARPSRQADPAASVDAIVARLCAAGLDRTLATDVANTVPGSHRRLASVALLRRVIADQLEGMTAGEEPFARAEVFVGPPGVGKTTTIAKIAAQERARRGLRLGLVAADGFRVGAVEQLRLYADIIGSPFVVARTVAELDSTLARLDGGPLLVDTAGRHPRERQARELIQMLAQRPDVRTHVVLSAATPPREAGRLLDGYASGRPVRVTLTRVDEVDAVGPLVGLLRERRLPISFLGTGQRVPEDLSRATASVLAAHLLGDGPDRTGDGV
jgi:flagellar biosynthesis protein FlhF